MTFTKAPAAVLDYVVDWSAWLDGDTIVDSEWVGVTPGLVVDSDSHTDTSSRVWLSGGVLGGNYEATNRIVTAGGRTDERSVDVIVRER